MRCSIRVVAIGLLLAGCLCGLPDQPPAPPMEVASATVPLVAELYAGETGATARPLGDRVRILLWLRELGLDRAQLTALRDASVAARADLDAAQRQVAALDADEAAATAPIYQEMASALALGPIDEGRAAAWADRLRSARGDRTDPRMLRQRQAEAVLASAQVFAEGLDPRQQARLVDALLFLRPTVGPGVPASDWDWLAGSWQAGDFSTLRSSASSPAASPTDIASLWAMDAGSSSLLRGVFGERYQALVALALLHPDLGPSCDVLLGSSGPLDGLEAGEP